MRSSGRTGSSKAATAANRREHKTRRHDRQEDYPGEQAEHEAESPLEQQHRQEEEEEHEANRPEEQPPDQLQRQHKDSKCPYRHEERQQRSPL